MDSGGTTMWRYVTFLESSESSRFRRNMWGSVKYWYPDLFWALRGGDGCTYGIVTSATYHTHPIFPLIITFISANFTSPDITLNVTTEFIKFLLTISGWGGYVTASNSSFTATFGAPNISWTDTNTTFLPFANYVSEATGGVVEVSTAPFSSFYEFYQMFFANVSGPNASDVPRLEFASRFLPRTLA